MKTISNIYHEIYDYGLLLKCYEEIKRKRINKRFKNRISKRRYEDLVSFELEWEENLITIQNELIYNTYKPTETETFTVREPKERNITSLVSMRDEIVQHALYEVITPHLERYYHPMSYACRDGRGAHAACNKLQEHMRSAIGRWGYKNYYVIKGDFKSYFKTIYHPYAKFMFSRIFSDKDLLDLIYTIIDFSNGEGISSEHGQAIGVLLSQHTANLLATPLDYFITDELKAPLYIRYMDDFRVYVKTREEAERILEAIDEFVSGKMVQELSQKKTYIEEAKRYDTFCGYKVYPHHFEPKTATLRRIERHIGKKIRKYKKGKIDLKKLEDTCGCYTESYLAHTTQKTTQAIADACNFIALEKERLGIKEKDKSLYTRISAADMV